MGVCCARAFAMQAYDAAATSGEGCRAENEELMMENVQLRDRLSMLESLAGGWVEEPLLCCAMWVQLGVRSSMLEGVAGVGVGVLS